MQITRELSRLLRRDASIDAEESSRLWGAILDQSVDDVEAGAAIGALAACGETHDELEGLYRAASARLAPWTVPRRGPMLCVPAYGAVPGEALWIALVAALLPRFGVEVVVHGVLDSPCGVSAARVLRELGILPCASLAEAEASLDAHRAAFIPVQLACPAFASLIALRARLGIENSAHVVAQALDPTRGQSIRLSFMQAGGTSERLCRLDEAIWEGALTLAWPADRSTWQVAMRPRIERLEQGVREVLFEADTQEPRGGGAALAEEADAIAAWVRRVASGAAPVPVPALNLVAACLYAAGEAETLSQAKAVAAIQAGRLAA